MYLRIVLGFKKIQNYLSLFPTETVGRLRLKKYNNVENLLL